MSLNKMYKIYEHLKYEPEMQPEKMALFGVMYNSNFLVKCTI